MKTTSSLEKLIADRKPKKDTKMSHQQDYYLRLIKKGVAKPDSYDLKPISSI